jgi:light-regulated signal transduction histidine kinase (bacteriophytochrome)
MNPTALTVARIDPGRFILVLIVSILISRIASGRARTEAALRDANAQLDERVRQRTEELHRANAALRESEARLIEQAAELERSNADLQHFAYVASHDLQEPLRMIGIYVEMLARNNRGKLDVEADRCIEFALSGVARMQRLVRDLLGYSRVIHDESPAMEPVALNEIVRFALVNLEATAKECDAVVEVGDLPEIICARTQISQVFQNLIANALKYRSSERRPHIQIRADVVEDTWRFSVSDNGLGISPAYHETIFAPFKRLHGSELSGTGIGLAICKRIVERHGGRLWVESELNQGSTFRFSIPHTARIQSEERRNLAASAGRESR